MPRIFMIAALYALFSSTALGAPGLTEPQAIGAFLNGKFANAPPGSGGGWTHRDYFPSVSFVEPIRIVEHPVLPGVSTQGVEERARFADNERAPWCYVVVKTQVPECQAEGCRKVAD